MFFDSDWIVFRFIFADPAVRGAMGCSQKRLKLVWRYHQLLSGFLTYGHLPRVSRQPRLSSNDKINNDMIPGGCVKISWHLPYSCLKPRESSARRPSMKVATSHRLKWAPFTPNVVGRIAQHIRKLEGMKKGKNEVCFCRIFFKIGRTILCSLFIAAVYISLIVTWEGNLDMSLKQGCFTIGLFSI